MSISRRGEDREVSKTPRNHANGRAGVSSHLRVIELGCLSRGAVRTERSPKPQEITQMVGRCVLTPPRHRIGMSISRRGEDRECLKTQEITQTVGLVCPHTAASSNWDVYLAAW